MKKLIAVTVFGLSLGFSAVSFASDYMDLYTSGPARIEVKGETKGGEIETSPMSFYLSPIKVHDSGTLTTVEETSDENT
ncbi:MAG TPA: hypothetical protein VHC46_04670, partial [Thermodesulfobacteriota bacterium]|nr:hypothetical protein [Thermodesulfobacteriota bacterium]